MVEGLYIVCDGRKVRELDDTLVRAAWWTVYVKCQTDPYGAAYFGPAAVVRRWAAYHRDNFGAIRDFLAFPYDDPAACLMSVRTLEERFNVAPGG